jgi:hypothetical protein
MTVPEGCHLYRERIGAFLLGKLDEGEFEAVRAHLNGCPDCWAEARELQPVVAALADADPDRIEEDVSPPEDLEESTLAPILGEIHRVRQRGRRSPWSTLAAAAVCVLAVGLAGFAWLLEPAVALVEPLSFSVEPDMHVVDGHLIEHPWGTEIELIVSGAHDGQTYRVTLVSEDGERVDAGTFIGTGDEPVKGTFSAALSRADAARLEARTPGGELVFFAKIPEKPRDLVRDWPLFGVLPWADQHLENEVMKPSGPEDPGGPTHKEQRDPGSGGGTPLPEGSPPESDPKGPSPPGGGKHGATPKESAPGGGQPPSVPSSPGPSSPGPSSPEPDPCKGPPEEQSPTCYQYQSRP